MRGARAAEPLNEELLRYGVEMAPVYRCLRRLVGQLAGIAILTENSRSARAQSRRGEPAWWPGHPTLAAAWESLQEARDNISRASVPGGQQESHAHLRGCVADLEWVISRLRNPELGESCDRAWPQVISVALNRAYRALKSAANEAVGFSLIDVRQSCCCPAADLAGTHVHSA